MKDRKFAVILLAVVWVIEWKALDFIFAFGRLQGNLQGCREVLKEWK